MNIRTLFTPWSEDGRLPMLRRALKCLIVCLLLLAPAHQTLAQQNFDSGAHPGRPAAAPKAPSTEDDAWPTMFPHPEDSRYLISGQANIIFQAHGPFHSPYEGANSLLSRGEYKPSLLGTLFLGAQLRRDPKTETDVDLRSRIVRRTRHQRGAWSRRLH